MCVFVREREREPERDRERQKDIENKAQQADDGSLGIFKHIKQ